MIIILNGKKMTREKVFWLDEEYAHTHTHKLTVYLVMYVTLAVCQIHH